MANGYSNCKLCFLSHITIVVYVTNIIPICNKGKTNRQKHNPIKY